MAKMLEVNPFFDYNVDEKCVENDKYDACIKTLYQFGYRTIAINQNLNNIDGGCLKKNKKGKQREALSDLVPEPLQIKPVDGCDNMQIFNRLTIEFASSDVIQKVIKSPNYKKYHIVAASPLTPQAFMFTCSNLEADILCFNPENKTYIRRNRKLMKLLKENRYHFEISYGPAIEDATKRKNIIHVSHIYHSLLKSRNIIISSGATSPLLIRSPYDIINLALIFGLNEHQAKEAVTHCGRQVYLNSVGRRYGKTIMLVETIEKSVFENISVIDLVESEEEMEIIDIDDEPTPKKIKQ